VRRSAATPPPNPSTALPGQINPHFRNIDHQKKRVAKKNPNRYDCTLRPTLEYFCCTDLKEEAMREGIHPMYNDVTVKCLCGNTFQTRSTLKEINTEICSACHPFFTGKQKLMDTAGRVERFKKRYGQI
jgi:large subunit ribosomal protein L31